MTKKSTSKTKVKKKVYHCHVCNKTGFKNSHNYKAHLFIHKAVPPRFFCKYCHKEFYRNDDFKKHTATHENNQKMHYCDHCGRGFVNKRNLILHLNVHDDLHISSKLRYNCVVCSASYCEERLLNYHIKKYHLNSEHAAVLDKPFNETWLESVKNSKDCVQMKKVKNNVLSIKLWKVMSKQDIKDKEDVNLYQQYKATMFAAHNNHYSKVICDYCKKEMLKKSIVKHIRETHLKLSQFFCEVCSRSFKRHYQLCDHRCNKPRRRKAKKDT